MNIITREQAKDLGLKRYYTGQECSKGHLCERYVNNRKCVECQNILAKKWSKNNKKKVNEMSKNWYSRNKEYMKEKRIRDKEIIKKRRKKYYDNNREKIIERTKKYVEKNRDKINERNRKYYLKKQNGKQLKLSLRKMKDKDRQRLIWRRLRRKRKTRIKEAFAGFSNKQMAEYIEKLKQIQGTVCYWCRENKLNYDIPNGYTIDHVFPISRKGKDAPNNIVLCCHDCNNKKRNKIPQEFIGKLF